jgi:hypothetical protein
MDEEYECVSVLAPKPSSPGMMMNTGTGICSVITGISLAKPHYSYKYSFRYDSAMLKSDCTSLKPLYCSELKPFFILQIQPLLKYYRDLLIPCFKYLFLLFNCHLHVK